MPVSVNDMRLRGPAAPLRVAHVHAKQLRREQGGLLPARTGSDLHDHVAIVIGVSRQQLDAQRLDEGDLARLQLGDDVAGHVADVGSDSVSRSPARGGELSAGLLECAVVLDDGRQLRLLAAEQPAPFRVRRDTRLGPLRLDVLQPTLDLVEAVLQAHRRSPVGPHR